MSAGPKISVSRPIRCVSDLVDVLEPGGGLDLRLDADPLVEAGVGLDHPQHVVDEHDLVCVLDLRDHDAVEVLTAPPRRPSSGRRPPTGYRSS